jgi:hypothetical protein
MEKIRLNLDALAVETFATTKDDGADRGTVRGHDSGGSGVGCASLGCESVSYLEQCICEGNVHPETFSSDCSRIC